MSTLERIRYIMLQHNGTFKLAKLIDTGTRLLLQTPAREADGLTPHIWATYALNELPGDLNASVAAALFNMSNTPRIDKRAGDAAYRRELAMRLTTRIDQSEQGQIRERERLARGIALRVADDVDTIAHRTIAERLRERLKMRIERMGVAK